MTDRHDEGAPTATGGGTPSRQVWFLPIYELLSPLLGDPGLIPGTPVWCELEDTDPAKWQAILWAAVWWAVGQDSRQVAIDQAAESIAAAEDWAAVARRVRTGRGNSYIARKAAS